MEKVRRRCGFNHGFEVEAEGSRGGLCLAWKDSMTAVLRSYSKNHVDVIVQGCVDEDAWCFTGFNGTPFANNRSKLWEL